MMVDWQISRLAAIWGAGDSGPQAIVDILKFEDVLLFSCSPCMVNHISIANASCCLSICMCREQHCHAQD